MAEKLESLRRPETLEIPRVHPNNLAGVCTAVADWLDKATDPERALALKALRISVEATRDAAVVRGGLPTELRKGRLSQKNSDPLCPLDVDKPHNCTLE